MATPTSCLVPLRRRLGLSLSTDRQDHAVTVAARSGSNPATACVTIGQVKMHLINYLKNNNNNNLTKITALY